MGLKVGLLPSRDPDNPVWCPLTGISPSGPSFLKNGQINRVTNFSSTYRPTKSDLQKLGGNLWFQAWKFDLKFRELQFVKFTHKMIDKMYVAFQLKIRTNLAVHGSLNPNSTIKTDFAVHGSLNPNFKIRTNFAVHGSLHPF